MLERIRGTKNVEAEFLDMEDAVAASRQGNWRKLFTRTHRPQLTCAILIPFFQQFTGINAIMFYGQALMFSAGALTICRCLDYLAPKSVYVPR